MLVTLSIIAITSVINFVKCETVACMNTIISLAQKGKTNKASDIHSMKAATTGIGGKSVGILSREKEELTQGLEVLEKTKQWYSDRLKQLAQEESHDPAHSKKVFQG